MTRSAPGLVLVGALLLSTACSSHSATTRADVPTGLSPSVRAAYLAEDADALRLAMSGSLLGAGVRESLELSRTLRAGDCEFAALDAVIDETPNWVGLLEHGECAAQLGHERRALEDMVRAADLAETAGEVEYILFRVCRAADESGSAMLATMCVGN